MARMVRKQIYITKGQDETLKRVAAERGQTEAEVVRSCLEGLEREADAREAERLAAWEGMRARMDARAEKYKNVPQEPRSWTRDELYEDRLARQSPKP